MAANFIEFTTGGDTHYVNYDNIDSVKVKANGDVDINTVGGDKIKPDESASVVIDRIRGRGAF